MIPVARATALQEEIAVTARANAAAETEGQYSRTRILGIWALAAMPMAILGWWEPSEADQLVRNRCRWLSQAS